VLLVFAIVVDVIVVNVLDVDLGEDGRFLGAVAFQELLHHLVKHLVSAFFNGLKKRRLKRSL
jgi:hypothetical protein